ncbi:hypothetical protein [Nocardioides lijunqiniae]|uniref:hypothetical protein n=1 Tax=Nocardioides lijunqiniae TaxID=2760832 RepID=UPI001877CC97|nr:hypothetical protein [Nocardioides lijunqiniae]
MRPIAVAGLALVLVGLAACSGAPDTERAEQRLSGVDGVLDADAAWVGGSFKVAPSAAVSVAVGDDLTAQEASELAPGLLDTLADLDWEASPALAVELDDDADATPFLPRRPDDDPGPRPTDVSTYSTGPGDLDRRDLAGDLALLVGATQVLEAPAQLEVTGADEATLTAVLPTDAAASGVLVREVSTDQALSGTGLRWRLTGPDLALEVESGLTPEVADLWALVAEDTAELGGLARGRVVLSVDDEQPLRLVRLELTADAPAARAAAGVTGPARRLYERLATAGVDELEVVVTGADTQVRRAFSADPVTTRWEPGA